MCWSCVRVWQASHSVALPPARRRAAAAGAASGRAAAACWACRSVARRRQSQGGRTPFPSAGLGAPIIGAPTPTKQDAGRSTPCQHTPSQQVPSAIDTRRSDTYYETKGTIFGALIEAIDLGQLAKLDADSAREEIRDIVNEIIAIKNIVMSIAEQEDLLDDICNDVLGYGPLEPLLARDEIADIMVNGSGTVYIEVGGKIQKTGIRFRDNQQLLNICQRIVSQVGRRVDESSPICDARLARRLARQRHRAAARDRRPGADHPQIQEGQADTRAARQVRLDFAGRGGNPQDHRPMSRAMS